MTPKVVALGCTAVLLLCSSSTLSAQEAGAWAGKRVMIVRDGVLLRSGSKTVGPAALGTVLEVSRVNGQWLWFKGRRGWIKQSDVAPYDKAIDHFSAAINRDPTSQAYHQRGVAHAAMGRFERAAADFSAAIERDPKNVAAYNDRGNARRKLGKLDEALADFNEVIRRGVRHPAVHTNRGLTRHDQGQFDEALADYNAAIAIDAKFAPVWEAGGITREAKGDVAKAISNYQKAIELDGSFVRARNNLAWILATSPNEEVRNGKQAVQHATKVCELTGFQDAVYLDTLAAALAESGQYEQAVKRANEAIENATDEQKPVIAQRLKLYEEGEPFRTAD